MQTDFSTALLTPKEGQKMGWRTRSKLAVRGKQGAPLIGLFKPGTHEVEDLPSCPDHHPQLDEALKFVRTAIAESHLKPYQESTGEGDLRYLQLAVQRSSGFVQLTLVANGHNLLEPFVEKISAQFPWHSIWINTQVGFTNTIFGREWQHAYGERDFWETYLGTRVYLHPGCFAQANPSLFEELLADLRADLLPQRRLLELYAGVGTIGLILAPECKTLKLVEINPLAEACFHKSGAHLPHCEYKVGDAKTQDLENQEVLVVDPTRKGLDAGLTTRILQTESLQQILYVSCHLPSFERDAQKLLNGGWELKEMQGYALFPGTPHFEIRANFLKKSVD